MPVEFDEINRDTATFRRLYEKVKHSKECIFRADNLSLCRRCCFK
jgi:hypothetical protein